MEAIRGIVSFVLVLGVIVALHELGHLLAAKFFNVYCAEYSIGMGPLIYQIKGKETKYSLRLLPVGGYVAMAGETEQKTDLFPDDLPSERTVTGLNPWKRIIVQLAGIIMNLILGIVLFTIVFSILGSPYKSSNEINSVMENSPAAMAGLQVGDEVIEMEVDGNIKVIESYEDMNLANEDIAKPRVYTVIRDGEEVLIEVTPVYDEQRTQYLVGIAFGAADVNVFEAFVVGLRYTVESTLLIFTVLRGLFAGIGLENLSGPVGIYNATAQVASQGFVPLLYFTGILSVNVGVLQLLPLPALDGGRVVFSLWEGITGKPVNQKVEATLILVSFALLFGLILFVTYKDIISLI